MGGTFTDVVHLDDGGEIRFEKVPTTPENPTLGVIASIARVDAALDRTSLFTHGTTLALNALLTRSGARTAVVATERGSVTSTCWGGPPGRVTTTSSTGPLPAWWNDATPSR